MVKNVVREMSIGGEKYERSITTLRSYISRISRGTVFRQQSDCVELLAGLDWREVRIISGMIHPCPPRKKHEPSRIPACASHSLCGSHRHME